MKTTVPLCLGSLLLAMGCGDDSKSGGAGGAPAGGGGQGTGAMGTGAEGTGATGASGGSGGGVPDVPLIGEVLTCGVAGTTGGMAPGADLQRYDLDLAVFPDALCNDGTGAVLYFRPYSGQANRNRWVVQLLGGGFCSTAQSCADRWCSEGTPFSMTQMTSNVAPAGGTVGNGIFERRPDNPIGNYNHVLLRYCSSDLHAGMSRDVIVQANVPGTADPTEFRMHFLGTSILDATLATLRAEGVAPLEYTLDGGTTEMPDLDDAVLFILAGASAGGSGTTTQVDRVAASFSAPAPQVAALIDSAFTPDRSLVGYDQSVLCADQGACSYEEVLALEASSTVYSVRADESCVEWHADNDPDNAFRCDDEGHVIRHHVSTPMVVRQGQRDTLLSGNFLDAGLGVTPGAPPMTLNDYEALVRADLEALAALQTDAEEGIDIARAPGVFGPTCDKHETLRSTADTFDVSIDVNGQDVFMFDVITNWGLNMQPSIAVTPAGGVETCVP